MTTNTSNISNRLPWLDFASGIMILWMIIYHAISSAWSYELNGYWHITDLSLLPEGIKAFINDDGKLQALNPCTIFPFLHFFMPWFFYKSGQFFQKRSMKELWQKDSQKLLETFVIWSFVGYALFLLFGWLNDSLTLRNTTYSVVRGLFLTGKVPINTPLWFLLTLFGVRFVANWLLPERGDRFAWVRVAAIVVIGYAVSYLAYRIDHRLLPYWVANGSAGLAFFAMGYALRDWEQKWWLVIPCAVVYLMGCIFGFPIVDMWPNELVAGHYFLWIPVSLCSIVAFNAFCRLLYRSVRVKACEWVGQNAMTIYVVHSVIFIFITSLFAYYSIQISSRWLLCVILFAYAIVLPLCCLVNLYMSKKIILLRIAPSDNV